MPYVITQISQAVRNEDRVNLYLNGKFWLGLSKNNLLKLKLIKGQQLTELEKGEIESTANNSKLIFLAVNYLQRRPRSCAEVRDYLIYRKQVSEEEARSVVEHLQDNNLLSDEQFTKWYIDYKLSSGANGVNKIKAELMGKKVGASIINEALENVSADEDFKSDQLIKIEEFAKKAMKSIKAKDNYEFKSKLTQKLMARGFKYADIKEAMKTLVQLEPA